MSLQSKANDEFEIVGEGKPGPSNAGPGSGGVTKESAPFFDSTTSPFDQEPSRILEGIFQDASSSKDYAHARREALDTIEQYGLHQHREQVFRMLDQFERGNSIEPEGTQDKGKGRDEHERPKRQHDDPTNDGFGAKRRRRSFGREEDSDDGGSKSDGEDGKLVFAWTNQTDRYAIHRNYRNLPLANKTNEIREYYLQHKRKALENLKSQITKPPFPLSLWEAVLVNQYVDFSKLYAIQGGRAADEEVIHESGKFKFVFNQIEAKGSIFDQGGWVSAFESYANAVAYAYPH